MCEKCLRIDDKIQHYTALARTANDRFTEMSVAFLLVDLKAEKSRLHSVVHTVQAFDPEPGP